MRNININDLEFNPDVKIHLSPYLSDFTTFKLGGKCLGLIECQDKKQLIGIARIFHMLNLPFTVIGSGSNIIVSDKGLDCYIIRFLSKKPEIKIKDCQLIISGSTLLDDLSFYALKNSYSGMNSFAGIPGTVAGAIVGNAGAFGKQISDGLKYITVIDKQGRIKKLRKKDLKFSYRDSNLKNGKYIILEACFAVIKGNKKSLLKERNEILAIRRTKHPDWRKTPCAGSIFRNIGLTSKAARRQAAGWFLEQAGAKRLKCGGASVFYKHANIIIGSKKCKAQDIYDLMKLMAKKVRNKFGLKLIPEVLFWGKF